MAATTAAVTSSIISATSQHKRDYAEKIRRLYPSITRILALVKGSNLDAFGKVAYDGKGMITKKEAKRMDPEWASYTPIDTSYVLTGGSSSSIVMADTTFLAVDDVVVNNSTGEVGIVYELYSSTTAYVFPVTGGTWSAAAGQYVTVCATTYEEGTARYSTITNELTTNKTYLQIFREGVAIADTVKNTPQYTEEGMLERYKTDKMVQALRKIENSFLFSTQATAGTTSTAITGDATRLLYTMKGIWSYGGTALDLNGSFNWETFNTVLYPQMPTTIMPDETVYMVCGRKIAATMNQWVQNKYMKVSDGKSQKFGETASKYVMGGGLDIELIVHNSFEQGAYANSAMFFQSSDLVYRFMTGMDLNIRENCQLPYQMTQLDIIEGAVGLQSWSAGAAVKLVTNLLPV